MSSGQIFFFITFLDSLSFSVATSDNFKATELLYSRDSQRKLESSLNGIIILDNKHRFKDDQEYGQLLTNFWKGDLSEQKRETIHSREVNRTSVTIPDFLSSDKDGSYACPYYKERNEMVVFPVNICTATTGHKLQGRSKVQGHPNSIFVPKTTREGSIHQLGVYRSLKGPNSTRTILCSS